MDFTIPRDNKTEILLHIWKVIDLPSISLHDLLYKISYELFLIPPKSSISFVMDNIQNQNLIKDENQNLKLSEMLFKKLQKWQNSRKSEILLKLNSVKHNLQLNSEKRTDNSENVNNLIKVFTDRATINRSVSISNNALKFIEFDINTGFIKLEIAGTKQEPYMIEINTKSRILQHNCHDFETRRADNKKFCKHLVKLFIYLKENDIDSAKFFLNELAVNISKWKFTT